MIGECIGNHKIIAKLGQGGMGTVYQAEDTTLGRKVAIKILNPALLQQGGKEMERFQSEAKVQASLNHPNIVVLHNFEPFGSSYYMVMEYVDGKTLAEIVRRQGPLPSHISVVIAKQVLDGLSAAHRKGIVHRDLKPSNIMITPEGVAKVMDFGIAKVQGSKNITASGVLVGTVYYMSPEQVRGEAVDARSDLYSFGIILFEMLTGRVPFKEESDFKIMIHHVQTPPPPPTQLLPAIPTALEDIVLRALSKEPDKRYQTADEIMAALEAFEEQERAFGRGQLYTRRTLSQWLVTLSGAPSAAQPELSAVPDDRGSASASAPSLPSGERAAEGQGSSSPAPAPGPAGAWTVTPPITPELRAQLAAQGTPASAGKGLFFIIGFLGIIVFLGGGTYYMLKMRGAAVISQKMEAQQTPASTQVAAQMPGSADMKSQALQPDTSSGTHTPSGGDQTPAIVSNAASAQPDASASTMPGNATPEAAPSESRAPGRPTPGAGGRESEASHIAAPSVAIAKSESAARTVPSKLAPPPSASSPIAREARSPKSIPSGTISTEAGARATQNLPKGFLIFIDLDQGSEKLPLAAAQSRVADVVRENGQVVVSSGVVSSNIRSALDAGDLAEVRRNGVGYVIMGTAHASLEPQNAYGSTYNVARVDINFEVVRMSDGAVAATGSGSSRSRGSANAGAALNDALMTATSEAARNLMRQFQQ